MSLDTGRAGSAIVMAAGIRSEKIPTFMSSKIAPWSDHANATAANRARRHRTIMRMAIAASMGGTVIDNQ